MNGFSPSPRAPDQLRSAVKGPDRYEPDINATYLDMAQHYGLAVIPARRADQAIWELLDELNERPFQKLEGCRNSAFEKLDRPMLRALPPLRYEFADRRNDVGVNIDCHIEYDKRYYSVHHLRIHQRVEVRATATIVEIFHDS
ncbi:MAG TPA: hypothetical protein VK524_21000 [Polyangiaceae bacterium]|nr:hypothetical protein [Polyangiaceae bacterium]